MNLFKLLRFGYILLNDFASYNTYRPTNIIFYYGTYNNCERVGNTSYGQKSLFTCSRVLRPIK